MKNALDNFMQINYKKLIASILIVQLAGFIGSFFTVTDQGSWYDNLSKPFFQPPNYVFGPVWSLLYLLIGISLYLVWSSKPKNNKIYYIFFAQLLLNTLWSVLFFGLQNPSFALFEIIILWIAIITNIYFAYRINKISGYLLIPYLLWVTFATILNYYIILLN